MALQNYHTVVVPNMEQAFNNLGAKYSGDPDIAALFTGVREMNNLITTFYTEGTQLHANHAQAVQEKQEIDENLLQSVAELSVQTEKARGLSKKTVKDVNKFLEACTTVVIDSEHENNARDFMTHQISLKMNKEKLLAKILKREADIERAKHAVKVASAKLPTLVMENAVLRKIQKQMERKQAKEATRQIEEAKRKRQVEALKQKSRVERLQHEIASAAMLNSTSLLDYEDDFDAEPAAPPRLADLLDVEAAEANPDSDSDSDF